MKASVRFDTDTTPFLQNINHCYGNTGVISDDGKSLVFYDAFDLFSAINSCHVDLPDVLKPDKLACSEGNSQATYNEVLWGRLQQITSK